jgi:DNA-binding SARP family transcriptional activator
VTPSSLVISLLGQFSLTYRGEPVRQFSGDRPISLLAYLLLHRHTAVSRQQLAFTLWPDSSDSQARTNLRNVLYTLRQTLPEADTFIEATFSTLRWRSDTPYSLDVAALTRR